MLLTDSLSKAIRSEKSITASRQLLLEKAAAIPTRSLKFVPHLEEKESKGIATTLHGLIPVTALILCRGLCSVRQTMYQEKAASCTASLYSLLGCRTHRPSMAEKFTSESK